MESKKKQKPEIIKAESKMMATRSWGNERDVLDIYLWLVDK